MDEEDDDFYDPSDSVPLAQVPNDTPQPRAESEAPDENGEEEVEVEDDEVEKGFPCACIIESANRLQDDFNIITEAPIEALRPET